MAYLGENIPKLGFGLMRLPMLSDGNVDVEQTKQMVDLFLSKGFTYFDTAYGYIDGKSEQAIKTALVDRYPRDSFQLATKLPAWAGPKTEQEAKDMFWTSLKRTGAGYFDFYLLHNLGGDRTDSFDNFHIWDFVADLKKQGLIKHLGFSMHSTPEELDKVLTIHPEVEFVQLQINYVDWESESVQSGKSYEVARKHSKPVIIMEPVKGGYLANLPEVASKEMKAINPDASMSSWAIRYAASLEGLVTVLSGMSTLAQMQDNVSFMEHFKPLDTKEQDCIERVKKILADMPRVACTNCKYCVKGCPQNVVIPNIFSSLNDYLVYGFLNGARGNYNFQTRNGGKASECIECGQCESVCPQHLHIIDELKRAKELFEN